MSECDSRVIPRDYCAFINNLYVVAKIDVRLPRTPDLPRQMSEQQKTSNSLIQGDISVEQKNFGTFAKKLKYICWAEIIVRLILILLGAD